MSIEIRPCGSALGAEVIGADLTTDLDDATFARIRDAFYQYEVVYFRGQALSDEDQIRFCARFGELRRLRVASQPDVKHAEIFVISNIFKQGKPVGSYDAGKLWHTDGAYLVKPHAISALRALEVPVQGGRTLGDTNFTSVSAAYAALPRAMKQRLEGLQAVQSYTHHLTMTGRSNADKDIYSAARADAEVIHPLVRVHPVNGRKCLYVTRAYTARIVGLPEDESDDLIAELATHCTQPEFNYVHNWQQHDLVMWDNCATQHKATFDYPATMPRLMHRTTVVGAPTSA